MSRQNFYRGQRRRQKKQVDEELVIALVRQHRKLHPRMGSRKLLSLTKLELLEAGVEVGRDRFIEILRSRDLLIKKQRSCRTTQSFHHFHKHSNLLKDATITGPDQAWVSDITYVRTDEGFLYLSLITDDYSRKIVGWEGSDGLEAEGCLRALKKALRQLPDDTRPIHHSDRGIQYCCSAYTSQLQRHGASISMTEKDHCYENAKAERVNGILKQEYGLGGQFETKAQAQKAIEQAIVLYNCYRPHQSLGYAIPAQVHRAA